MRALALASCLGQVGAIQVRPESTVAREAPEARKGALLHSAFVINVKEQSERWEDIQKRPWFTSFDGNEHLPELQRFDAKTHDRDNCTHPYSLEDCCTMSHKTVMWEFGNSTAHDDQWVLIFEDDVELHPDISPDHLGEIITNGLQLATEAGSGITYFGICGASCADSEKNVASMVADINPVAFDARCSGKCTHAYAVKKSVAGSIPEKLDATRMCTVDQALSTVAKSGGVQMSLLGHNLRSPDPRSPRAASAMHSGLFYQRDYEDSLDRQVGNTDAGDDTYVQICWQPEKHHHHHAPHHHR